MAMLAEIHRDGVSANERMAARAAARRRGEVA